MDINDSYFALNKNRKLKGLFFILFGIVIIGLFYIFRFYVWPFLTALILSMALKPFYDFIYRYVKKRSLSSLIVIVLLILVVMIPLLYLLISLANQTYELYVYGQNRIEGGLIEEIRKYDSVKNVLGHFNINEAEIVNKAAVFIEKKAGRAFSSMTSIVSYPISLTLNFFFMILMLFFLLKDGYRLSDVFYRTLPFPDDIEKSVVQRLKSVIRVLLAGNILIMFCQGLMVGIGLHIAGFTMPLLWGSVASILSLIPVIGTTLIWLPAVIYLIITKSYFMAVFLGVWSLFWYLMLENLLKPKIFGERLNFHPVLFFFLLLGSIQAFNIPGIIIGPLLLTLFYSLWDIYRFLDEYKMNRSD